MATLTPIVDPAEVTRRAAQVRFLHVVITSIAALLYGIGWIVAALWFALCWCAVAVRVGFEEGTQRAREANRGAR